MRRKVVSTSMLLAHLFQFPFPGLPVVALLVQVPLAGLAVVVEWSQRKKRAAPRREPLVSRRPEAERPAARRAEQPPAPPREPSAITPPQAPPKPPVPAEVKPPPIEAREPAAPAEELGPPAEGEPAEIVEVQPEVEE